MTTVLAGLASFAFVFLKAFQQRNVAFNRYAWIVPCSYGMAATEVYVVAQVAVQGWDFWLCFSVGTGAGAGAVLAMLAHNRIFDYIDRLKGDRP